MKVWILTSEYNLYDQNGEYFLEVFLNKPSIEKLADALDIQINESTEYLLKHIQTGGGRINDYENVWYYLKEVECK